jgi:creatinine amidohydrolase/Fe(II)-dependent formamide hydrolase-like protein
MRYELMLPHQIRTAIAENWPVVLPLGVLEYHGEHMAVGMDTLAVVKMLELLEPEMNLVIMPPFYYGAASYAVESPEGNGSVQVDGATLAPFAEALFFSLLRIGFRNIHAIIHHQTENFAAGMPTDLAFKSAGRQAIFRFIERESGEGWWGNEATANYYAEHAAGNNPFNWVQVHPLMSPEIIAKYPFDHAGKGETSLMLALWPEAVDMTRFAENKSWYTASAKDASAELGAEGRDLILPYLRTLLGG